MVPVTYIDASVGSLRHIRMLSGISEGLVSVALAKRISNTIWDPAGQISSFKFIQNENQ